MKNVSDKRARAPAPWRARAKRARACNVKGARAPSARAPATQMKNVTGDSNGAGGEGRGNTIQYDLS